MAVTMADFAQALSQATGWKIDEEDLWQAGARITTLERAVNLHHGLQRADDELPDRFHREPLPSGAPPGRLVVEMDRMVSDYYALRGWDKDGVPTPETLERLGLGLDLGSSTESKG